jgi:hypothetical protein
LPTPECALPSVETGLLRQAEGKAAEADEVFASVMASAPGNAGGLEQAEWGMLSQFIQVRADYQGRAWGVEDPRVVRLQRAAGRLQQATNRLQY